MVAIFGAIESALKRMHGGTVPLPAVEMIDPGRCTPNGIAGVRILRDQLYFTVRINEMYLKENQSWYSVYDPLVVVVVEFNHGSSRVTIPAVIGPGMITKQAAGDQPKHGSVIFDSRVTGPHPYRGGDVDISTSFYRVRRMNYALTLFKIVEQLSGAFAGAGQVAAVAQTGAALLEGVEGLIGLGDSVYLAGQRISLVASKPFVSGFSALLAPPVPQNAAQLSVREGRLFIENGEPDLVPYRTSDFVLMSVTGSTSRQDENLLPFYGLKTEAINAISDGEEGEKRGKANLIAAYQQMRKSPDVTSAEASNLLDDWLAEFKAEQDRIRKVRAMPFEHSARVQDKLVAELNSVVRRINL
jgi:hypothetical protein